jgi:phosphatidylglycerophosphate synthase
VTSTRAAFVGCVAALTAQSFLRATPVAVLVTIGTAALVLDAVDGKVARRTNTASRFGARFDMEVDSFLLLVLSIYVAPSAGMWVLTIGAIRYVYVVACRVVPWLGARMPPPRYWCKAVAAIQGIVLVFVAADISARPVATAALAIALALILETYGNDLVWLWRHRHA